MCFSVIGVFTFNLEVLVAAFASNKSSLYIHCIESEITAFSRVIMSIFIMSKVETCDLTWELFCQYEREPVGAEGVLSMVLTSDQSEAAVSLTTRLCKLNVYSLPVESQSQATKPTILDWSFSYPKHRLVGAHLYISFKKNYN